MDEGLKKYRHLSEPHNKSSVLLTVETLDLTVHTFLNLHIEPVLLKAHYTGKSTATMAPCSAKAFTVKCY